MAEENKEEAPLASWLWDKVSGFFVAMFQSVWAGFLDLVEPTVTSAFKTLKGQFHWVPPTWMADTIPYFSAVGMLTDEEAQKLRALVIATSPIDWLVGALVWVQLLTLYVQTITQAASGKFLQELNAKYSPTPPGPGEVIQAAFIAPEKTGEVRNAMRRAGLSEADIDLLFISAYRLYDPQTIRDAWFRGVLNDDEMYMRMRELGFTDTRIKEIVQTWQVIPPIQDILTMYAKEAFEPDIIQATGLDQEFPEEGVEWAKKLGLSRDWLLKYWYAHWDYPSVGQGFDMLHRGVLSPEELDMLFRIVEIPKFWRDKLTAISYNPFTRVDIRRMHAQGVITDDELVKNYKDAGYDQYRAEKLAAFTVKYNTGDRKDLVTSQLLKGYTDKLLTREEAKGLIVQAGYNEEETEFLLLLQEYIDQKSVQDDIIATIKGYYTNNLIERKDAEDRLNKLNLPAMKISSLLERWEISRIKDQKIPSKTDLDKFLRNKIIDEDKYRYEMTKLGYGWVYTDWYLQLIKKGKAG